MARLGDGVLIASTDVGRPILTVGGTIPWTGDSGLDKMEKAR